MEKITGSDNKAAEYAARAKALWGDTAAYREYERKNADRSPEEMQAAGSGLTDILSVFGQLKDRPASDPAAQAQVKALQDYITGHFYTCTDDILAGLGRMYAAGGEFTDTIDRAGGVGAARFAAESIEVYCRSRL